MLVDACDGSETACEDIDIGFLVLDVVAVVLSCRVVG